MLGVRALYLLRQVDASCFGGGMLGSDCIPRGRPTLGDVTNIEMKVPHVHKEDFSIPTGCTFGLLCYQMI